jgi:hypothetical protein
MQSTRSPLATPAMPGKRLSLLAAPLLLLALSACGGGDPAELAEQGYRALGSGDAPTALAKFEAALKGMDPADERYLETRLGALRARAYGDDRTKEEKPRASAAVVDFLALGGRLRAEDYRVFVTDLASAGAFMPAVDVLKAGQTAYPEDPKWESLIQRVGDAAKVAGAGAALSSLKGLGYIGGDEDE